MTNEQVAEVLGLLQGLTIEEHLKGIQKAQELYKDMFAGVESMAEWSRKATVVESLYNLIRNELKIYQIRIRDPRGDKDKVKAVKTPKKPTGAKPAKKKFKMNEEELKAEALRIMTEIRGTKNG